MPDLTIPDAAVEAAARALDANFNPDYYPIMSAMFSDYAMTALTAAAPYIAAQALRDAAGSFLAKFGGFDPGAAVANDLNARADRIEADHG